MNSWEEYKIFLEQVNKLADRRQYTTTIYLTVNAAIIGALAFLFKDAEMPGWQQQATVLVLLLAGIVACDLWRRLLYQYKTLLGWWYKRLHLLEESLQGCSCLIKQEYEHLYATKKGHPRLGLTRYEVRLTWLFTILYGLFSMAIVVAWILE